ncbi:MAG: DUF3124 domain-containing protein [Saprospiraceae bacterium]|nr:DUF3124 domain-containing protein [Saprospiraceae bacterium]
MKFGFFFTLLCIVGVSCIDSSPNVNNEGENIIESMLVNIDISTMEYQDTVYIPVYSDIYSVHKQKSTLLTATLSIRSTSLTDTTYINTIDYYDTHGDKIRSYIDQPLMLLPMASVDYVIERDDVSGGIGANFLVTWGADKNTQPLFQAVMISTTGQHGLSFVTNGISTKTQNIEK